jgi:hypothetical protein
MLQLQTSTVEMYETETLALAALGVGAASSDESIEPSYARRLPLLVIREMGEVASVRFRSETPASDEPVEIGRQLRELVTDHGRCKIILNLSGLDTTSTALNVSFFAFSMALRRVNGRLAICCIGDKLAHYFRFSKFADRVNYYEFPDHVNREIGGSDEPTDQASGGAGSYLTSTVGRTWPVMSLRPTKWHMQLTTIAHAIRQLESLLQGTNYAVQFRLDSVPFIPEGTPEQYVRAALGEEAAVGGVSEATTEEMLSEVEECIRWPGDDVSGPDESVLVSPEVNELVRCVLSSLELAASESTSIQRFWLKAGHPFYPVFWDFVFLLIGTDGADVFIGSASD